MVLFLPRDAASVPVSRQVLDGCLATLGLTGRDGKRTTVHLEKALDWVPGAAGEHLFSTDGAS